MDYSIARYTYAGNRAVARSHRGEAKQMLKSVLNRLALGGVTTGRDRRLCADGSIIEVRVTGDHNAIEIWAPEAHEREVRIRRFTPDFVSGVVVENGASYYPTEAAALPRADLTAGAKAPGPPRLDVPIADQFDYFQDAATQYEPLRPSQWTGKMRQVVQAALGFGKADVDGNGEPVSLYTQQYRETFQLPEEAAQREQFILDHQAAVRFRTFEDNAKTNGRTIYYDYRYQNTDGIYTADDGRLWLVKINSRTGVLAMPLPLHGHTVTPEFRAFLEAVPYGEADDESQRPTFKDDAAIKIVEDLGGFPTGMSMPSTLAEVEAYKRAGLILELVPAETVTDMAFGDWWHWSAEIGWAFSEDGTEAHNCAYRFRADGFQEVAHIKVSIDIGDLPEPVEAPGAAVRLADLIDANLQATDEFKYATRSKLYRMPQADSESFLAQWNSGDFQGAFDAVNAYEIDPITSSEGSMETVETGPIYTNEAKAAGEGGVGDPATHFAVYPAFFGIPDDTNDMALHAQSLGNEDNSGDENAPVCDTTIFVYFQGNTLKRVRFWRDTGTPYDGNLSEGFYSEDVDLRQKMPDDGIYRDWYSNLYIVQGNRCSYMVADCKTDYYELNRREITLNVYSVSDYGGGTVDHIIENYKTRDSMVPYWLIWPKYCEYARLHEAKNCYGDSSSRVRYADLNYKDGDVVSDGDPTVDGDFSYPEMTPRTTSYIGVV